VGGTIKRLVSDKGFGFIRDEQGVEYFFHRSMVHGAARFDQLREGDAVEFTAGRPNDKGHRAESVERR
jgi:CspA family cold shock protein